MHAHRLRVVIPEDRRVVVQVPEDVPEGPAEILVLVEEAPLNQRTAVTGARRIETLAAELARDPRSWKELTAEERQARLSQVVGIGRGVFSTSEEYARHKQEEIRLEEERLGR